MEPIYLDNNATTQMLPEVAEAMADCYRAAYVNPASSHELGRTARRRLEAARDAIGMMLGAEQSGVDCDQVIFTSGGTESNNLAVRGLAGRAPAHAVVSAIEHPSISELADQMQREGWQIDRLGVDRHGVARAGELGGLLRADTRLVAVMLGNNETGAMQPVAELAETCKQHNIPMHTDAAQAVGKLPVDFRSLGVTTMSVAAHKFHGPVGVGVLVVRSGVTIEPLVRGGFQQGGTRPGTESVALAVGMQRAMEIGHAEIEQREARMCELRDSLEASLREGWPELVVNAEHALRLPHTSNISFPGLNRQALLMALDLAGVACSTGSACASGSSEPSPVLLAMGADEAVVEGSLRLSLSTLTTLAEIAEAVRRILDCCRRLAQENGLSAGRGAAPKPAEKEV